MFIAAQAPASEDRGMLPALLFLLQAASAAPPAPPPPAPAARPPGEDCRNAPVSADSRTIVVCAPKPEGYRIDPDVLEARREHRNQAGGPKGREMMQQNDCATVGPMGCRFGPAIDLVSAAATLAKMAATASQGGNVGKMFETTPEMSEYQLYVEAKKRREAKEAAAAAAKAKAAAQAPRVGPPAPANQH
jgi:hypothetical protein